MVPQGLLQAVQCSLTCTLKHLPGLQRTFGQSCMCHAASSNSNYDLQQDATASSGALRVHCSLRGWPGQSIVASRWSNTSSSSGERASIRFSSAWEGTSAPLLRERLLSSCSRGRHRPMGVQMRASCLQESMPCIALQGVPAVTLHRAVEG